MATNNQIKHKMFKYFTKKNTTKNLREIRIKSALSLRKRGFAVLFAVLLSSFLITLGISIFTISLKEIQITTSVRDSQIAYYVADSARECALYWDVKEGVFPACLDNESPCTVSTPIIDPTITCNGIQITLNFEPVGNLTYSTYNSVNLSDVVTNFFYASSTSPSSPVSDISIIKVFDDVNEKIVTTVEAYGHNTMIIGRRVERGIKTINN